MAIGRLVIEISAIGYLAIELLAIGHLAIEILAIGLLAIEPSAIGHLAMSILHTDRSGLQFSRVLTKNYSTAPRVPMGIWGLVCDPETQI